VAQKSIIASGVEEVLFSRGHHPYLLDGDNVRFGLNKDLGFLMNTVWRIFGA